MLAAVQPSACPQCMLPLDEGAWQCDGCGHVFSTDFPAVRSRLSAELTAARTLLVVTIGVGVVILGAVVYLATLGMYVVSVPLALAIVGSIGAAAHKHAVGRERVRELDRRHRPLPAAIIHRT